MNKIFKCDCGSDHFFTAVPHQYEDRSITGWNTNGLQPLAGIVTCIVCINCFKIIIPPANMSGKTILDPNVSAYGELIKWVNEHNKPEVIDIPQPIINMCGCSHKEEMETEDMGKKMDKQLVPGKSDYSSQQEKNSEPRNTIKPKQAKTGKKKVMASPKSDKGGDC